MDVVVLSIQLAGSVQRLRRFLNTITEGPNELKRLLELLEQLEFILEQIGGLVKRQRGNVSLGETSVLTSVLRAVNTCESKLAILEGVVEATKQLSAPSSRVTSAFGSLKLACKKKDIQNIEHQLRDSVNFLSLTIMANLTFVSLESVRQFYSQTSAIDTIGHELVVLRGDLANMHKDPRDDRIVRRKATDSERKSTSARVLRKQSIVFRNYTALFGTLLVRSVSQSATLFSSKSRSPPEIYSTNVTSWSFLPSFLSYGFEYQSFTSHDSIRRSLRIYPLIPKFHPIWKMCNSGNLEGIQTLLTTGEVSPFSVDEVGNTLLHEASKSCRADICELLFDLGLNGQEATISGLLSLHSVPYLGPLMSLDDPSELSATYSLFTSRCEYFDETDFLSHLFMDPNLEITLKTFEDLVHDLVSKVNVDTFETSPLSTAMKMFHKSDPDSRNAWKELIYSILALGPDIHHPYDWGGGTVLSQVLDIAKSSFESQEVGDEWLAILEDFGIDIAEYLGTERLCQYKWGLVPMLSPPWSNVFEDEAYNNIRYQYINFSDDVPRISWDWYIHPSRPAFEVLHEFRNFGPGHLNAGEDYQSPEAMFNWPYFYPRWQSCLRTSSEYITKEMKSSLVELFKLRFERRWFRKVQKLQRAQGFRKDLKIPGAWTD